ncbi:hypothetical protein Anapl_15664 [Anas platyrhynchos]|uniref:Uncharacterized protein n=1 Tax=Anas platyrhynchos TaxID=8839 RepID=R0JC38_ANAPL|nr:hypothetical protein Anapl_15664 [Anas platyrhynchos]
MTLESSTWAFAWGSLPSRGSGRHAGSTYSQKFSLAPAATFTAHLPRNGVVGFSGNTLYESIPVLWGSVDGSWGQAHPARHLHKVFPTALTALPKPGRVLPRHIPITASLVCCCSLRSQLLVLRSPCATQEPFTGPARKIITQAHVVRGREYGVSRGMLSVLSASPPGWALSSSRAGEVVLIQELIAFRQAPKTRTIWLCSCTFLQVQGSGCPHRARFVPKNSGTVQSYARDGTKHAIKAGKPSREPNIECQHEVLPKLSDQARQTSNQKYKSKPRHIQSLRKQQSRAKRGRRKAGKGSQELPSMHQNMLVLMSLTPKGCLLRIMPSKIHDSHCKGRIRLCHKCSIEGRKNKGKATSRWKPDGQASAASSTWAEVFFWGPTASLAALSRAAQTQFMMQTASTLLLEACGMSCPLRSDSSSPGNTEQHSLQMLNVIRFKEWIINIERCDCSQAGWLISY